MASKKSKSALSENKGVKSPPSINPMGLDRFKAKRNQPNADAFVAGILAGDKAFLSRAITLVESTSAKHQELAQEIIDACIIHSGKSIRIGITGVPGVGKSTFIEAFGLHLIKKEKRKVAILAIDPSSKLSHGSILGDKTRMEELTRLDASFIRPSPAGVTLGGVARKTRESIILCEAAGYDTIIIETVGVGQSETAVHSMVDFFLLLMLAGAGDDLQGIKRGIMEMADGISINKADGDNLNKAKVARMEYQRAIHLFPPTDSGWIPKVLTCSALEQTGVVDLWEMIEEYHLLTNTKGFFDAKRKEQAKFWMNETISEQLHQSFHSNPTIKAKLQELEALVLDSKLSPFAAAKEVLSFMSLEN
jgi:LAO/AO transport system kinase